ncbi:hypothetical protein APY03_3118 [Variovorax sp. WDL1]|nr:hypothetical protein APY03_3118 [Variovorax sp. WDL1]
MVRKENEWLLLQERGLRTQISMHLHALRSFTVSPANPCP